MNRIICKKKALFWTYFTLSGAILTNIENISFLKYTIQRSRIISDELLSLERMFLASHIIIITDFVVVFSIGLKTG